MANEAVKRYDASYAGSEVKDFTIGDGNTFLKGSIMSLNDPRLASGVTAIATPCAGILARDKVAGDGRTRVSVYRDGDWDVVASGTIPIGAPICTSAVQNIVQSALGVTAASGAAIIGYALEAASDAEVFQMRLKS